MASSFRGFAKNSGREDEKVLAGRLITRSDRVRTVNRSVGSDKGNNFRDVNLDRSFINVLLIFENFSRRCPKICDATSINK